MAICVDVGLPPFRSKLSADCPLLENSGVFGVRALESGQDAQIFPRHEELVHQRP